MALKRTVTKTVAATGDIVVALMLMVWTDDAYIEHGRCDNSPESVRVTTANFNAGWLRLEVYGTGPLLLCLTNRADKIASFAEQTDETMRAIKVRPSRQ